MRAYLAYAMMAALCLVVAVQPAMAFNELGIPFMTSCDFVYMAPFSNTGLTVAEFNQATLMTVDFEDINIDFPAYSDGMHLGASILGAGIGDAESAPGGTALGVGIDGNAPAGAATAINDASSLGAGVKATANVVPFGLVNLAFPDIDQTVFQSIQYQRTYFFTDFFV